LPDGFNADQERIAIEADASTMGDQLLAAFDQGKPIA
jgi:hypothetical protein